LVTKVHDLAGLDIDGAHHQMNCIVIQFLEIDQVVQRPAKRSNIIDAGLKKWSQQRGIDIGRANTVHARVDEQGTVALEHRRQKRPVPDRQTFPPQLIQCLDRVSSGSNEYRRIDGPNRDACDDIQAEIGLFVQSFDHPIRVESKCSSTLQDESPTPDFHTVPPSTYLMQNPLAFKVDS